MPPKAEPQAAKIHSSENTWNRLEDKNLDDEQNVFLK